MEVWDENHLERSTRLLRCHTKGMSMLWGGGKGPQISVSVSWGEGQLVRLVLFPSFVKGSKGLGERRDRSPHHLTLHQSLPSIK